MEHNFTDVFDTTNPLWENVLKIFNDNENYKKKKTKGRCLHHKFPRSFSKLLNENVDNDSDNLISLSLSDHFMIHYYYYKLAKEQFKARMALAFSYMMNCKFEELSEISPDTALVLSKEYEETESEILKETGKARIGSKRTNETIENMKAAWIKRKENGSEKPLTEEQKQKISNSLKGIKRSEETKKKISEARKRIGFSEEHRQHIREAKANKIYTDEERYRMGNGMRGKHPVFSEEHNKKISQSKMGHTVSDEARRKMSEKAKGRKLKPETIEKMKQIRKGKHWKIVDGKRVWY